MPKHTHAALDVHARDPAAPPPAGRDVMARRLWRSAACLLVLLAIASAMTLWARHTHSVELHAVARQQAQNHVFTVMAKRGAASASVDLPGTLRGFTEAPIGARSSGYLVSVPVDIGSRVKRGDLLAEISSPEADQQLAQSLAARVQLDASVQLANSSLARWQTLRTAGAVSLQAIDERRSTAEQAQATLAAADANISRLRQLQAFKRIVAPFDGVITKRNVSVGDLVDAGGGARALFVLTQMKPLRAYIFVPQAYALKVKQGDEVVVSQAELPGQSFTGTIVRTGQSLDPANRSLQVEVALPNDDGRLLAGAYVNVRMQLAQADALVVPANTLLFRAEGPRVAVVGTGGRIRLQPVKIGKDYGQSVEILSGVGQADDLVVNPADAIAEGDLVMVRLQAAGAAAGR
ncbi:MAG: efflux transporter, family, subunit [Massilia sp.]|jgi:RND family efflux transporter MFP subunit|nr:efflux transporter, family, subunit [Massilia sp.]MDB5950454.1 efflux transporter, family, subunit [Massilia sp.]